MTQDQQPTQQGVENYPPDGFYRANNEPVACTCKPQCGSFCKGECGCAACRQSFQDFGEG